MIKVMLVDDDAPMLKYLSKLLPWQEMGLEVVATAQSSKRALHQFYEIPVDIVITDIGMPHMDGLELVTEIKRSNPHVRVIFLTCHEDFKFARKAVQLQADDYLIKDELTEAQLRKSLIKAIDELKEVQEKIGESTYKQELMKNKGVLKHQFFKQITLDLATDEIVVVGRRMGIDWKHSHFFMALGYLHMDSLLEQYRYEDEKLLLYAIENISEELEIGSNHVTTFLDPNFHFVCLLNYQPDISQNTQEQFLSYLSQLQTKIKEFIKVKISVYAAAPFRGVDGIRLNYKQMKQWNHGSYYNDTDLGQANIHTESPLWSMDEQLLSEDWNLISQGMKEKRLEKVTLSLNSIELKARELQLDPVHFKRKCSQRIHSLELENRMPSDTSFHTALLKSNRLDETMQMMLFKMTEIQTSNSEIAFQKTPKLQKIDQYILEHLNENISLVDIAEHLYLNPSYLSRNFKEETGMNFTDYVHLYKMKLACQMVKNKQANIELIGLKLGYQERTYFSKIFKKYVGVSPKDYR
ncbi:response regulator [Paenibacillus psychroresistens]|uniref:Response regulator n=1 Tax=Paenibacillus psychroresistens TaxID=1778678 RepID=A0A6B8RHU9_9BACL|nr:response regulator [Paenibacillus psychroresistens]QGQ95113.1 response regulator [Paenibacillus psychroresistens]